MNAPELAEARLLLELDADAAPDAIRRAYARALKRIDPEADPDAFQALRAARDMLLAASASAETPRQQPDLGPAVASVVERLECKRRSGDVSAAIAALDAFLADEQAGSPLVRAVGFHLFETVAQDETVPPDLFMAMVDRFEWRDASGPAARENPELHGAMAERITANDWYASLLAAHADHPDDQVAATLLCDPPGQMRPEFDEQERSRAYHVINLLRKWGTTLLPRFDARNLAALRDAAQGLPYGSADPTKPVAPAPGSAPTAVAAGQPPKQNPKERRTILRHNPASRLQRLRRRVLRLCLLLCLFAGIAQYMRDNWDRPPSPPNAAVETMMQPANMARSALDQTVFRWVVFTRIDNRTVANFAPIVADAAAIRELRYGFGAQTPVKSWPLPAVRDRFPLLPDQSGPTMLTVPDDADFLTVSVVFNDGSESPIVVFPIPENWP